MNFYIRGAALILAALAALGAPHAVRAQPRHDEQQLLIAQIQADKSAIVLRSMELDDAQVQAFTPIYDEYQLERKKLFDRTANLLNLYAASYESMTDDAGRTILKDWFALQEDEIALTRKYAKRLEKVLPPAKVVRFVQIENKLDTLLRLKAEDKIPLAR
jgi:soluble lytic murein transglycosylase-like protein